jgi:hypothetical protein
MAKQQAKQPSDADNINGHIVVFDANIIELYPYEYLMGIEAEHQLTTDSFRMGVVVIKMKPGTFINKRIGAAFKGTNLIEYNPEASLSMARFDRMLVYLHRYLTLHKKVNISDITISFVVSRHPRVVLKHIKDVLHWKVTEEGPGMWLVVGGIVTIQIIETKLLPVDGYLWLKNLNRQVKEARINQLLDASKKLADSAPMSAYMYVILKANRKTAMKVMKLSDSDFNSMLQKHSFVAEWQALAKQEIAQTDKELAAIRQEIASLTCGH